MIDKVQSIKHHELYQLLQLQCMDVVNWVAAYAINKICKFLMGAILQRININHDKLVKR
jgi:hypothetical protein